MVRLLDSESRIGDRGSPRLGIHARARGAAVSSSVDVPPIPPAAAGAAVGFQELELDHLLVADLAVEIGAGELQVLVQPLEHHLGSEGALLAPLAVAGGAILEAGDPVELGLIA